MRELGLATVKSSGSCDHSGGYGFRAEPDVCDPIDEDIFRNYYTNLFIITLL